MQINANILKNINHIPENSYKISAKNKETEHAKRAKHDGHK
jgi:hypothetical protein